LPPQPEALPVQLNSSRAAGLSAAFEGVTIAVLGDLMLDHFIWGSVSRISPEAPVPVVRVTRESFHLGGAGNVVNNLASLGARPLPVGVIGDDEAGRRTMEALQKIGAGTDGVLQAGGRTTTKKTRVVAHAQQVVRFDREDESLLDEDVSAALGKAASAALREAKALIVSDYEKGTVSAPLLKAVLGEARRLGIPVVVDPKPHLYDAYTPVTAITPNLGEAAQMAGIRIRAPEDRARAAAAILKRLGCKAVLLTLGDEGMLLCEEGAPPALIGAAAREVYDVTGAGDTVVAAFTLALAAGATMPEAAQLANAAAGVVVGKVGTATATREEIMNVLSFAAAPITSYRC